MTVYELKSALCQYNEDTQVFLWDDNSWTYRPVEEIEEDVNEDGLTGVALHWRQGKGGGP